MKVVPDVYYYIKSAYAVCVKNIIVAVQTGPQQLYFCPVPALETGYIPQICKSVFYNWEPVFSLEQLNG